MAAATGVVVSSIAAAVGPCALSSTRSELSGSSTQALGAWKPARVQSLPVRGLKVVASGGKKISTKEPYGPSGGTKFKGGVDASGRKITGKGVYQFGKKYGANVDGYSPIWTPSEWAESGDVYAGGQTGLLLWALTFGALLIAGALLVYNTSALA